MALAKVELEVRGGERGNTANRRGDGTGRRSGGRAPAVHGSLDGNSHRDLLITGDEWEAFIDDLNQSLDKFEVPQQERSELLAIIGSTKDAIVVGRLSS
jgi:hypothetical protein